MLTWPIISAGKSKRPTFMAKAIAKYGRDCALPGFARALEPSPGAPGDGRERLARAPSRRGQPRQEKTHDGTIVTGKVNGMWGTDMSQTVTLEEGRAYVFVAVEHANSEIVGIHAARSANRFEALEPVRQGVLRRHRARRGAWAQAASRSWLQLAAFPAAEARRLAKRFEWHYTPKHGSWLDMAESELAVLTTQCLRRRIPNKQVLQREVGAWQDHRNKHHAKADWQFTTDDARVKLKRLYPHFE